MSVSSVFEIIPPGEVCNIIRKTSSAEEVAFFGENGKMGLDKLSESSPFPRAPWKTQM